MSAALTKVANIKTIKTATKTTNKITNISTNNLMNQIKRTLRTYLPVHLFLSLGLSLRTILPSFSLLLFLCATLSVFVTPSQAGVGGFNEWRIKTGHVMLRGLILTDDGTPIYSEYLTDGSLGVDISPKTGAYKDVYRRPYELNASQHSLGELEEMIGRQNDIAGKVSALSIAKNLPGMFKLSDRPSDQRVGIAHGWSTVRLRFLMEVETPSHGGMQISYIQGYTDYHDPSLSGTIDPHMPFNINSITTVRRVNDQVTGAPITHVQSSFNVVNDPLTNSNTIEDTTQELKLIRPKDVLEGIGYVETFGNDAAVTAVDNRNTYDGNAKASNRTNNVASEHMASVINGYINGNNYTDVGYDRADTLNHAAASVSEQKMSNIPFIEALHTLTGAALPVTFTLAQVDQISPGIGSRTYQPRNGNEQMINTGNILDSNDTEDLFRMSTESTIANTISEGVTSLLVENLLSGIDFTCTNMTPNPEPEFFLTNVDSFIQGIDKTAYVNRFIDKFTALIMSTVTMDNSIGVRLLVHADVLGDTAISVSINNGPDVLFRLPTFCDSLYNPNIANANEHSALVNDFSNVINVATSATSTGHINGMY